MTRNILLNNSSVNYFFLVLLLFFLLSSHHCTHRQICMQDIWAIYAYSCASSYSRWCGSKSTIQTSAVESMELNRPFSSKQWFLFKVSQLLRRDPTIEARSVLESMESMEVSTSPEHCQAGVVELSQRVDRRGSCKGEKNK